MAFMSCSDKGNDVYLKNSSYSECTTGENKTKAQEEGTAYVTISAINKKTLKIDMYHVLLNCGLKKIESDINYNGKTIIISFTPIGNDTNCLCERQLTYEIGNLQEGQSYDCIIIQENMEYASFKFDFTGDLTKKINLN
mgnify:CR=1 FL=1